MCNCNCPHININKNSIPQMECNKFLRLHFGRTLIWDIYKNLKKKAFIVIRVKIKII